MARNATFFEDMAWCSSQAPPPVVPVFALVETASSDKIAFSAVVLGANSTLCGWYLLTSAVNNYNPIWGQDGSNEIYYGSGNVAGKVEIVKAGSTIFRSTASVVISQWHLLCIVDNGVALKAYYDDVDMGDSIGGYTSLSGISLIRASSGENSNNYHGNLDELLIFNRALSAGELTTLYNAGAGLSGNMGIAPFNSGLVLGYHLDEGTGLVAADFSGNGRTGTITNQAQAGNPGTSDGWTVGKV